MPDGVPYVENAAVTIATDDIGGQQYQRNKIVIGDNGVNDGDVSENNPLPVYFPDMGGVGLATADKQDQQSISLASIATLLTQATPAGSNTIGNVGINGTVTLSAGSATSANQTTANASLSSIDTKLTNNATTTLQTTGNNSLSSIDTKLTGLSDGTQKAVNRGGAKGTTTAADVTSTASGANHQGLDIVQWDTAGNARKFGQSTPTSTKADIANTLPVGIYNSAAPTVTDGQVVALQVNNRGALVVDAGVVSATTHTQALVAVATTAGGTPILAANPNLVSLTIQNQDASNPVWISTTGAAPTATASFIKIAAGGSLYFGPGGPPPPSAAVSGISTTASVNVHVLSMSA
jgi:hypothetical protein